MREERVGEAILTAEDRIKEVMATAAERELARQTRVADKEERRTAWREEHDAELERRREVRAIEKEGKRGDWAAANLKADDRFELEQALNAMRAGRPIVETEGREPADIIADMRTWKAGRQAEMARMKALGPIDAQTARAPSVNPVSEGE